MYAFDYTRPQDLAAATKAQADRALAEEAFKAIAELGVG